MTSYTHSPAQTTETLWPNYKSGIDRRSYVLHSRGNGCIIYRFSQGKKSKLSCSEVKFSEPVITWIQVTLLGAQKSVRLQEMVAWVLRKHRPWKRRSIWGARKNGRAGVSPSRASFLASLKCHTSPPPNQWDRGALAQLSIGHIMDGQFWQNQNLLDA